MLVYSGLKSKVTGRSIPVVRLVWDQIDRVRFSAPRQNKEKKHGFLDYVLPMGAENRRGCQVFLGVLGELKNRQPVLKR